MTFANVLTSLSVAAVFLVLMEPWTRWVHRAAWHGPLWQFHRSHHGEGGRLGGLELNDLFVAGHAAATAPLFAWGIVGPEGLVRDAIVGAAIGISMYGMSYFVVHDGVAHGRFPVGPLRRIPFVRRVAGAHRAHHVTGRAPFGLFRGPSELRSERAGSTRLVR